MATYREVKGYSVKSVSSDPANVKEGQIWYNSTAKVIKVSPNIAAWASSNSMSTARANTGNTSSGPRDASLVFGGESSPNTRSETESYDGSSWTNAPDINTGRRLMAGFGTQTAAVCSGGIIPPATPQTIDNVEEWDGSSWTEVTDVPVAGIYEHAGTGTLTAGLIFAGDVATGDARTNKTYHYDGTNWTAGGDMNTSRRSPGAGGTQTAAVGFGGIPGGPNATTNVTELYDGSSWTNGNNMGNDTGEMGYGGPQTNAISASGSDHPTFSVTRTELYDGTNWSAGPTVATARKGGGTTSASGNTSAILFGGLTAPGTPNFTGVTEEFTAAATTRTVDVS